MENSIEEDLQPKFIQFLNDNNNAIFYLTAQFEIIKVNQIVEKQFDCLSSSLTHKPLLQVVKQYHNPITTSLINQLKAKGATDSISQSKSSVLKPCNNIKSYDWELIESFDKAGRHSGFVLTGRDTTHLMKRLEDYRQISHFLKKIVMHLPHYIFWKDTHSVYLGCNNNFAELIGLSNPDKIIGRMTQNLACGNKSMVMAFEVGDEDILKKKQSRFSQEIQVAGLDNKIMVIEMIKVPLYDSDKTIMGVLALFSDLTDKHLGQGGERDKIALDSAHQTASDILASMSHNFRTPLNSIIVSSQFLKSNHLNNDQADFVSVISESAKILLCLVEDVLNFAKIETGKFELHEDRFDLRQTTEEIFELMANKALQKKVDFIMSYNESIPRHVIGDAFCFHRLIMNLVDNAIKFTTTGYVLIKFSSHKVYNKKVYINIIVEDTGTGVDEKNINFIFKRFTRIEPSYKGYVKGTGLGLAMVKELIKKMDGSIQVESCPNRGSQFIVSLPFTLQDISVRGSLWSRHCSNLSVLIIDDQEVRAHAILKQIATKKSQWLNGETVLDDLKELKETYDIFLIDDEISGADPIKLAKMIRRNPLFKDTMLFYFSNPSPGSVINTARQAGFFAELIKPVKPSELVSALGNAWGRWLSTHKGVDYLIKTLSPIVLVIENDKFMKKLIKMMLNEFGYMSDFWDECKNKITFDDHSYDMIILDEYSIGREKKVFIKKLRKHEDKNNPIPIIMLGDKPDEKGQSQLMDLGVTYFVDKPIDHLELKKALLHSLFPKGVGRDFDD